MKDKDLVNAIRRLKVETRSLACIGCGHGHNCGVSGCAIMREAADRIVNQSTHIAVLQMEIEKLRGRLMQYEDTELTPEEIDMDHEAAEQLRQLCRGYDLGRLVNLAEADKAGRVVVRPSFCLLIKDLISSMLLAFTVAIISDISIIQCPCILRYTFSSSSFFKSSENQSSLTASKRKKEDLPAP